MRAFIMAVLLVLIFACAVVCAQERVTNVVKDVSQFAVFPAGYELEVYGIKGERVAVSLEDCRRADALVTGFMRGILDNAEGLTLDRYRRNDIKEILPRLSEYRRQCFGLVNAQGNVIVWINYFRAPRRDIESYPDWHTKLVYVHDGGAAYFNVKVNLTTGEVFDFLVNGEA